VKTCWKFKGTIQTCLIFCELSSSQVWRCPGPVYRLQKKNLDCTIIEYRPQRKISWFQKAVHSHTHTCTLSHTHRHTHTHTHTHTGSHVQYNGGCEWFRRSSWPWRWLSHTKHTHSLSLSLSLSLSHRRSFVTGSLGQGFRITYPSTLFEKDAVTVLCWYESNSKVRSQLKMWRMGINCQFIYPRPPTSPSLIISVPGCNIQGVCSTGCFL